MKSGSLLLARLKALAWTRLTDRMHLSWVLPTGITVRVRNYADWCTYNEIFVNGEYDEAIRLAMETSGESLTVLDLGGNAGYFSLRLADRFLISSNGAKATLKIDLMEASSLMAAEARARTSMPIKLGIEVKVHTGLVGKRSGTGRLMLARENNQNFVGKADVDMWKQSRGTEEVAYIDLENIVEGSLWIDLVKCDIEGSEFEFIKSYPDLLRRVRHLVVEFHPSFGDVEQAQKELSQTGLEYCRTLRSGGNTSVAYFRNRSLGSCGSTSKS